MPLRPISRRFTPWTECCSCGPGAEPCDRATFVSVLRASTSSSQCRAHPSEPLSLNTQTNRGSLSRLRCQLKREHLLTSANRLRRWLGKLPTLRRVSWVGLFSSGHQRVCMSDSPSAWHALLGRVGVRGRISHQLSPAMIAPYQKPVVCLASWGNRGPNGQIEDRAGSSTPGISALGQELTLA